MYLQLPQCHHLRSYLSLERGLELQVILNVQGAKTILNNLSPVQKLRPL